MEIRPAPSASSATMVLISCWTCNSKPLQEVTMRRQLSAWAQELCAMAGWLACACAVKNGRLATLRCRCGSQESVDMPLPLFAWGRTLVLMGTVDNADASFAKATCCHALHAASTSVTAVGSFNTCPIAACRVLEAGTISILGNNDSAHKMSRNEAM